MATPAADPEIDAFIGRSKKWRAEFAALRRIVSDFPLTEALKWGAPCYSLEEKNIVLMHGFKDYCALLFFKGALLKDPNGILVRQTENVQAARQLRFTGVDAIVERERVIRSFVQDAIDVEKAGLKIILKTTEEFAIPDEFRKRLDEDRKLKDAFDALTPGRRRAYLLHFSSAKRSRTREARIENCVQLILDGKGLDD